MRRLVFVFPWIFLTCVIAHAQFVSGGLFNNGQATQSGGGGATSTCATIIAQVSNITGCWNADEGVTKTGSNVTAWTDQTTNGYVLGLNAAGTNTGPVSPVFNSSSYNSRAGITCTAASREYLATTVNAIAGSGTATSFFIAAAPTASTQNNGRVLSFVADLDGSDFSGTNSMVVLGESTTTTTFESLNNLTVLSTATITFSTPTRFGIVNDNTTNNTIYVNNVAGTPAPFTTTLGNAVNGSQLAVCESINGIAADALMDGPVRRILMMNRAANSTDRGFIDTWLQQ